MNISTGPRDRVLVQMAPTTGSNARLGQKEYPVTGIDGVTTLIPKDTINILICVLSRDVLEKFYPNRGRDALDNLSVSELLTCLYNSLPASDHGDMG